jgi:hypothetical protein
MLRGVIFHSFLFPRDLQLPKDKRSARLARLGVRYAAVGTLLIYADEHDRQGTQRTLADLVARQLESENA